MIAALWRRLTAPFRSKPDPFIVQMERATTRMQERRADALSKRKASVQAQKRDRLLARDFGLDPDTLNQAAFGRPRPSQQRKGAK